MTRGILLAGMVIVSALAGCETAPRTEGERDQLVRDAEATFARMAAADEDLPKFVDDAAGHAVFPSVGKGGIYVGGAYGRGVVYDDGVLIGYCDLSQATIGLQLGGQQYSELIVFETQEALDRFTSEKLEFAAQVSAVALKAGASKSADYRDGVAVFTADEAGLMYEASVGGQKFTYRPK